MTFEEIGIKLPSGSGPRFYMPCPKCKDDRRQGNKTKPCLTVDVTPGNEWWICHNCDWKGSLKEYKKYEGVYKKSRMPATKASIYSKEVQQFLDSKQLSAEVMMALGVYEAEGFKQDGEKPDGSPKWVKSGHMDLCFPYYRGNTLRNVMFRKLHYNEEAGEAKFNFVSAKFGSELCFWGLDDLDLTQPTHHNEAQTHNRIEVIITEGHTDRVTWVQSGFKNVISIPNGVPSENSKNLDAKIDFLTQPYIKELFKNVSRFYIAMDADTPGQRFKEVLAENLGRQKCYIIAPPFGYNDGNEVYAGNAKKNLDPLRKEGIIDMYDSSTAYPIGGIMPIDSVDPYLQRLRTKGFERGLVINEKTVDGFLSVKSKMVMVVTGVPSHGKSTWVRWYLTELCITNPTIKFGMYSPESRPVEREYAKLMEVYSKKVISEKHHNAMSDDQYVKAKDWVRARFTLINPTRKDFTNFTADQNASPKGLVNILRYMKYLKETQGIFGFVIDAWNKIDHELPKGMVEEKFISKQLDYVLDFCEAEDLFCVIIAHPTKMEDGRGGNVRKPSLYSIKGSSAWYEKADIGVVVYRKKFKKSNSKNEDGDDEWEIDADAPSEIHVDKMKFDELGREGMFKLWIDRSQGESFTTRIPEKVTSRTKKAVLEPSEAAVESAKDKVIPDDEIPF